MYQYQANNIRDKFRLWPMKLDTALVCGMIMQKFMEVQTIQQHQLMHVIEKV